jgi:chromosomal replication initiator protein
MSNDFPFDQFFNFETKNPNDQVINHQVLSKNIEIPENNAEASQLSSDFDQDELAIMSTELLDHLKQSINEQKYNAYFSNTFQIKAIQNDAILCSVTTNFIKKIIESHYKIEIERIIKNFMGKAYELKIEVLGESLTKPAPLENSIKNDLETPQFKNEYTINQAKSIKETSFSINDSELYTPSKNELMGEINSKVINHIEKRGSSRNIDPKKSFDNFIVGPSNSFAHATAIGAAKAPGKVYPSIYLYGNSGLGKTHLLHAIGNYISTSNPSLRVCIISTNEFMNEIVNAIKANKVTEFRNRYSEQIDVLMIDDIHELKGKEGFQKEFFHLFNELHQKGKQLVFTSDKQPKEIDGIQERIKTRLSWGMVVDIQQPDLETRIAILKEKATEIDIFIPDDVVNLIARSVKSNIRELEGSLIKLGAYSSVFSVDIDLDIAKEQLKLDESIDKKVLTLELIGKAVSTYFKIPVADIRSKSRSQQVTLSRHISMHISYNIMGATLAKIGEYYGGRDHTTVLHGVEKINRLAKTDQQITTQLYEIESSL